MEPHNNNNDQNNNGSSSSPQQGVMMSSPSEAFSECMSHLLICTEELRRSCIQATTSATTSTSSAAADGKGSMIQQHNILQPDQVFAWQHSLEHSILPLLDQLARWTADVANPASMEADLFQHCHNKAIAVAQIVLETVIKYFSESALVDQMETAANAASNNDGNGNVLLWLDTGEPMEIVLRNVQGSIARITELCLVLIAGNDNLVAVSSTSHPSGSSDNAAAARQKQLDAMKAIIQSYVSYQRQVLRQRCRPAIAKLVQIRKQQQQQQQQQQQSAPITSLHHHHHHNDDTDDDDDDQPRVVVEQHHAAALTVILGQAAALIHPLIVWKMTLQQQLQQQQLQHHHGGDVNPGSMTMAALYRLCTEAITTLDEQTCKVTRTVSDWFYQDRPVDEYMQKCAAEQGSSIPQQAQLCILNGLVEEMAYTSQVLARYHALLLASSNSNSTEKTNHTISNDNASSSSSLHSWIYESLHLPQTLDAVIERELIPEWTWKYAALERFLAVQQWQSALLLAAQPVQIVMGTRIFVPSIVEDAQYLSTRALERAASTRSTLAIGTVAHAVSHDVWSTEEQEHPQQHQLGATTGGGGGGGGGVYQALLQERGCWAAAPSEDDESKGNKKKNALGDSSSNDFAAALLDALDEDLGSKQHSSTSPPHSSKLPMRHPSAPTSGGFLTSTLLAVGGVGSNSGGGGTPTDQVLLETRCCVLNGIHAAAGACRSLVEFLDALLLNPDDDDDDDSPAALQQPNNASSSGVNSNDQATAMIHLAREELFRYAKDYDKLLSDRFQDTLTMWCGGGVGGTVSRSSSRRKLCFDELRAFFEGENYNIDAGAMKKAEADERLEHGVVAPLKESLLLQQLSDRCESDVLCQLGQVMVTAVVDIVLDSLWSTEKKMTDWGSLLLSKQVRLLQGTISKILAQDSADAGVLLSGGAAPNLIQQWERLSQVCNVLQLEQPAEWLMYLDSSVLSAEELEITMSLRVDFSRDAIQKVVATAKQRMQEIQGTRATTKGNVEKRPV